MPEAALRLGLSARPNKSRLELAGPGVLAKTPTSMFQKLYDLPNELYAAAN